MPCPGARHVDARIPVRILNFAWHRLEWPPVESLAGPVDIAHSLHPLLMPSRGARPGRHHPRPLFSRSPRSDRREKSAATTRRSPPITRGAPMPSSSSRSTRAARSSSACASPPTGSPSARRRRPPWPPRAEPPAPGPNPVHRHASSRARTSPGLLRAYAALAARRPDAPELVLAGRLPAEANRRAARRRTAALAGRRARTSATSATPNVSGSIARRRCWSCRRSTRASACRRSKR